MKRSSSRRRVPERSYWRPEESAARFERLMSSNDEEFISRRNIPLTRLVPLVHTVREPVRGLMRTVLSDTNRLYPSYHGVAFPQKRERSANVAVRASLRSVKTGKAVSRYLSSIISPQPLLRRALECAKHSIRREVILALGKGGGEHRPPRYRSHWRC